MLKRAVLASVCSLLMLTACVIEVVPTEPPTPVTPITQEQAVQIALRWASMTMPEGGRPLQYPRNPRARLTAYRDCLVLMGRTRFYGPGQSPEMLVWVVQFEGGPLVVNPVPGQTEYRVISIDAQSGLPIAMDTRSSPLL